MYYTVEYIMSEYGNTQTVVVTARNRIEAYDEALYNYIRGIEGTLPYAAWVASVTYTNGSRRNFKSFPGNPY